MDTTIDSKLDKLRTEGWYSLNVMPAYPGWEAMLQRSTLGHADPALGVVLEAPERIRADSGSVVVSVEAGTASEAIDAVMALAARFPGRPSDVKERLMGLAS